jgi:hypothetical protein
MILVAKLTFSSFCDGDNEQSSFDFSIEKNTLWKVPLYTSVADRSREGDLGGEFVKP